MEFFEFSFFPRYHLNVLYLISKTETRLLLCFETPSLNLDLRVIGVRFHEIFLECALVRSFHLLGFMSDRSLLIAQARTRTFKRIPQWTPKSSEWHFFLVLVSVSVKCMFTWTPVNSLHAYLLSMLWDLKMESSVYFIALVLIRKQQLMLRMLDYFKCLTITNAGMYHMLELHEILCHGGIRRWSESPRHTHVHGGRPNS